MRACKRPHFRGMLLELVKTRTLDRGKEQRLTFLSAEPYSQILSKYSFENDAMGTIQALPMAVKSVQEGVFLLCCII